MDTSEYIINPQFKWRKTKKNVIFGCYWLNFSLNDNLVYVNDIIMYVYPLRIQP